VTPVNKRERAAQTRVRMLGAAFALFAERGYQGTTMAAVAKAAGVAEQTMYFTFGTKAALLREVMIAGRTAAGEEREVPERRWFTDALEATDQRRTLAVAVEGGTEVFRRLAPIAHAMASAELVDPDVAVTMDMIRGERREAMGRLVDALAANGPIAVSPREATDVIDVVESITTFNSFVAGCGWTVGAFKAWAYITLTQLLPRLPPARATKLDRAATADLTYSADVAARVGRPGPA
jgi:AcrR family transcriptional regulator